MDPDPSATRIDPHLEVREHKKGITAGRRLRPHRPPVRDRVRARRERPPGRHQRNVALGARMAPQPGGRALVPDRSPDLIGARGARAAHQAQGAGRLQQRQHQLIGLCHRGDDAGAGGGRGERLRPGHAADAGHRCRAGHRRHQLPPDDQGVSARRLELHRRVGQPGGSGRPGRRRGAADRLHPDSRRFRIRGRGGDHLDGASAPP